MKRKSIVLSQLNNAGRSTDLGCFDAPRQEFFSGIGSERIEGKKSRLYYKSGPVFYSHRIRLIPEGCSPAEPFPFHLIRQR